MEFPTDVKLSPGLVYNIDVTFRPIRLEEYDDFVEVYTEKGSFKIPIYAKVSKVSVQIPSYLDIIDTPVNETNSNTFEIINTGQLPAQFKILYPKPFRFEPGNTIFYK